MCNVQSLMNATLCVSSRSYATYLIQTPMQHRRTDVQSLMKHHTQIFFFTLYHKHQCNTNAALADWHVVSCKPQSRTLAEQLLPCLLCPANHLSTTPPSSCICKQPLAFLPLASCGLTITSFLVTWEHHDWAQLTSSCNNSNYGATAVCSLFIWRRWGNFCWQHTVCP